MVHARKASILVWLLGTVLISVLSGCGSSRHSGPELSPTGAVQGTIEWPEKPAESKTRLIPIAAESIVVSAMKDGMVVGSTSPPITRPQSAYTIQNIPVGTITLRAVAYPSPDGTGTPLAVGAVAVAVMAGQTVAAPDLVVGSTIDRVEVTPAAVSLSVGEQAQLSASALDAQGRVVLVPSGNWRWLSSNTAVAAVDATGKVTGVGVGVTDIAATETDSGKSGTAAVTVTSSTEKVIATVRVGDGPWDVAVDPSTNMIYVTNQFAGTVSIIDGSTNHVVATVPVGARPSGIDVNTNTKRIYVANYDTNDISVISATSNTEIATVALDRPMGIAVNSFTNRVYVGRLYEVSVIDGATNSEIAKLPSGDIPNDICVNPTTNRIYIPYHYASWVSVVDGTNNGEVATIPTVSPPYGLAVNTSTNRVYVTTSDRVVVVDGVTNRTVAEVTVGTEPRRIAVNPSTNRIYVSMSTGIVNVIDGTTDVGIAAVPVGGWPNGIAVNSSTNRIYVANSLDNTVTVIQGGR